MHTHAQKSLLNSIVSIISIRISFQLILIVFTVDLRTTNMSRPVHVYVCEFKTHNRRNYWETTITTTASTTKKVNITTVKPVKHTQNRISFIHTSDSV